MPTLDLGRRRKSVMTSSTKSGTRQLSGLWDRFVLGAGARTPPHQNAHRNHRRSRARRAEREPSSVICDVSGPVWRGLRLAAHVTPAHLSACPCIPSSRPPIVLPLSSSCSQSVAPACSQAEPSPQGSLRRCCPLGPLSERQRSDLRRATDIVLVENGAVIYWPRTSEQFHIADAAYAIARVQATLA